MSDWRTALEFVPLIVFVFLFVFWSVVAIWGGYKRALIWGISNLILYFIALIFTVTLSDNLATFVVDKFNITIEQLTHDEMVYLVSSYMGIIFYIIFLVFGNLLIVLPLYEFLFKRIFKIGKFDPRTKAYAKRNEQSKTKKDQKFKWSNGKYVFFSRVIALPCSIILAYPSIATISNISMAATVTYSQVENNSYLSNIYWATNWWNNILPSKNNYFLNTDAILAALKLSGDMPDGTETYIDFIVNNFEDLFDNIASIFNEELDSITPKDLNSIIGTLESFTLDPYEDEIVNYLNCIGRSDYIQSFLIDFVSKSVDPYENAITKSEFENVLPFIYAIKHHTTLSIKSDEGESTDLTSFQINVQLNKINISYEAYHTLVELSKSLFFDQSTYENDAKQLETDASNLLSIFFNPIDIESTTSVTDIKSSINYDLIFASYDIPATDNFKKLCENANGSENNPYVIPADLFYSIDYINTSNIPTISNEYLTNNLLSWSFYPIVSPVYSQIDESTISVEIDSNNNIRTYLNVKQNTNELSVNFSSLESISFTSQDLINGSKFQVKISVNGYQNIFYFELLATGE